MTFRAVTWNLEYTTPPSKLRPILHDLLDKAVSVFLIQEITRRDVREMIRGEGLHLYVVAPRYAVAWKPNEWHGAHCEPVDLTPTASYKRRGGQVVDTKAARAILTDAKGRSLDALSYQLPSSVQRADPLPGRLAALHQSIVTMRKLGKATDADACLFGGDDNVDERLHHGPWGFMEERATGLKLTQAPDATHAGGRKLDDFRTRGLVVSHGWTQKGGGDHRLHGRTFSWK